MSNVVSKEVRLKARPEGMPKLEDFEVAETEIGAPGDGEVLIRNIWMSVDPYMRGRMYDRESYVPPFQIGAPLEGGAIGQVVASNSDKVAVGDYVQSMLGWREYAVAKGEEVQKVDENAAPIQAYLGTLGMPGMTAYAGLLRVGELKDGETVFVSAASGAVGAVVCQIAKAKGCFVVGTAGSDDKCKWLEETAGIDKAINYKTCGNLTEAVREAAPKGIDVYFENVGGEHLVAALENMRPFGRLAMCGMISQYNDTTPTPGPNNLIYMVGKSLKMQGFIVSNHFDLLPDFIRDMSQWIKEGKIKWEETVEDGIERAPNAFLNLFTGGNFGKMLVKVGPDKAV
ncbi:NADP-dependent oxidoreductase [Pyruvatibacter mobilis]|jgi:NADPH-dependent curcumin reductase CurA|uniref:Zinc-binding dehydrogenase n=1 Tax=Pyruvatibacter mobilis TaxID=1712261 RepID=A0A845QAI9_9HYPH|nr:NADP-dependent oxidoreductase [Pyruvatibacter mobilis]NBG95457.1 zinc-binding dehydrogenase [Pyruvatibacter mobilis]QJD75456.1 NADP-dependent oxidoreductase [Pyruvatibacter mobilis]GGD15783.1 NADP-dependent oxidoreductase [Pyruvatibacter mobilis]